MLTKEQEQKIADFSDGLFEDLVKLFSEVGVDFYTRREIRAVVKESMSEAYNYINGR